MRWQAIVRPTYAVLAIKQSAIQAGPKPHGVESGGAEWGNVIHTLLEAAMKQPSVDLRGLALSALETEDLPATLTDSAIETVNRVIASSIWQRARASERCLTEVPLSLPVIANVAGEIPTIQRGVIDLVFREAGGWVIVDYKSERVEADQIPALVDYYRPQIEAYASAWTSVTGDPTVEFGLLFTHSDRYVVVR